MAATASLKLDSRAVEAPASNRFTPSPNNGIRS